MIPKTIFIQENNFNNAWARAVKSILREGIDLTIGDESEPKLIKDACVLFELTGDAIKQIENRELHPQFPFQHINQYCDEFTRSYQKKYKKLDPESTFSYTYFDRFVDFFNIDQLEEMKYDLSEQIKSNISSNRNQIITWSPYCDMGSDAAPCLQSIWVRYLGKKDVEVHWHFRSRDLFTAYQANVIALIDMLNREVIKPNRCRIVKLIDYSDSCHIYKGDIGEAKKVKLIPINPQNRK